MSTTEQVLETKETEEVSPPCKITHEQIKIQYEKITNLHVDSNYVLGVAMNPTGNCQINILRHIQYCITTLGLEKFNILIKYAIGQEIINKRQILVDIAQSKKTIVLKAFQPYVKKVSEFEYINTSTRTPMVMLLMELKID
jgi:hypothetical protein